MQTETATEALPPSAPETKPEVTPQTKFKRGGWKTVEQVESEGVAKGEREPVDAAGAAQIAEQGDPERGMPESFTFVEPGTEPEVVEPAAKEAAAPNTSVEDEGEIRLGGRVFKTQKEAWDYAQELEYQKAVNDAFRQGVELTATAQNSNIQQQPQRPPEPETMPDEYYMNPAAYWSKEKTRIAQQAEQRAYESVNKQLSTQQMWQQFWNDYPDLGRNETTRELTSSVFNANFQSLSAVQADKALKIIADKTRSKMRDLGVSTLPQKVLPSSTKPAASPGTGGKVTIAKPDEKPLNFVSQFKNLKKSKSGFSGR